jgi:hypothetical protein
MKRSNSKTMGPMIESLEDRQLYSASPMGGALMTTTTPSGSGATMSQLVVVQGSQTPVTRPNVVIAIIAILIG